MSLTPAAIRILADKGLSASDIADVAEACAAAPVRSANAERQARYRARKAETVTNNVTSNVTDVAEKGFSSLSPAPPITTLPKTSEPNGSPRQKARASKRVPAEWSPSPATMAIADAENFSPGELERALSMFRDHEFKTAHSDWDAAARNWLRRAAKDRPRERPDPRQAKHLATQGNNDAAYAGSQVAARMRAGYG